MKNQPFYITTTLPYVNAQPHVGFAGELILTDVRARFARDLGYEVVFNTGTDEHGVKIYEKALEAGKDPQAYVDEYAAKFDDLKALLNISNTHFVRTTDETHIAAATEIWKRVDAKGFIYKKQYSVKYCNGCELEKTDSELEDGFCPVHPGKDLALIEEENYFFKFAEFADKLLSLYNEQPDFVYPSSKMNEIRSFVENGLQDFSISRVKEKMPWGVPVPGDDTQVMYVWFDALTSYISTLGWPSDDDNFTKYWGTKDNPQAIQTAGKDNLRQQSAMWQAMLMAADLPRSKQIFIGGFISVDGKKMSKSIGNVIAPSEMVSRYGVDGTRYLLLTKVSFGDDSDISWDKMDAKYNADLANGLGNLTSRIITLAEGISYDVPTVDLEALKSDIQKCETKAALEKVWGIVDRANKLMEEKQPWSLKKKEDKISQVEYKELMERFLQDLHIIATYIKPFLPETSEKIFAQLESREKEILFVRV